MVTLVRMAERLASLRPARRLIRRQEALLRVLSQYRVDVCVGPQLEVRQRLPIPESLGHKLHLLLLAVDRL